MCDYCGCRSDPRSPPCRPITNALLALTASLRRAHEAGVAAPELVAELTDMLQPHARREEHGVFAALIAEGIDAGYVARFELDHSTLEELLSRGDADDMVRLVELLEDHILQRGSDLFPAAHQLLGSVSLGIDRRIAGDDHGHRSGD